MKIKLILIFRHCIHFFLILKVTNLAIDIIEKVINLQIINLCKLYINLIADTIYFKYKSSVAFNDINFENISIFCMATRICQNDS